MRTTEADVHAIIGTTVDVVPFMITASLLVDTYLSSKGLSNALLREIERWWTAHLVSVRTTPALQSREIGDTVLRYATPKLGLGLQSTLYGQTVLTLYPGLATLSEAKRATFDVE
jgi:hypothetical protein